jgi:hypothetical protein
MLAYLLGGNKFAVFACVCVCVCFRDDTTIAERKPYTQNMQHSDSTAALAIKDGNFIGAGQNFCSVGWLPLE